MCAVYTRMAMIFESVYRLHVFFFVEKSPAFVDVLIKNLVKKKTSENYCEKAKKRQNGNKMMHVSNQELIMWRTVFHFHSILQFQQNTNSNNKYW